MGRPGTKSIITIILGAPALSESQSLPNDYWSHSACPKTEENDDLASLGVTSGQQVDSPVLVIFLSRNCTNLKPQDICFIGNIFFSNFYFLLKFLRMLFGTVPVHWTKISK